MDYNLARANQLRQLAKFLPLNSLGLPKGIWRPDLLPAPSIAQITGKPVAPDLAPSSSAETDSPLSALEGPTRQLSNGHDLMVINGGLLDLPKQPTPLNIPQEDLDNAFVPIEYDQGYPQLPSGYPFWSQLEFEPSESFLLFNQYIEMGQKTFRLLHNLVSEGVNLETLQIYSALYYWPQRARSYDLFYKASIVRDREAIIYDLELEHLTFAKKYRTQIQKFMEGTEFEEQLTPMVAVNLLKLCWQMERVSVGLPLNGPAIAASGKDASTPSLEVAMRSILKRESDSTGIPSLPNSSDQKTLDENGRPISDAPADGGTAEHVRKMQEHILNDPRLLELAQELVIRVNTRSN